MYTHVNYQTLLCKKNKKKYCIVSELLTMAKLQKQLPVLRET